MRHILLALFGACCVRAQSNTSNNLRRSLQDGDKINCRYVRGDIRYEDGTSEPFDACEDGKTLYELPSDMLRGVDRLRDLHSGRTRLEIQGAKEVSTRAITETDHIEASGGGSPQVSLYDPLERQRDLKSVTSNEIISTTGRKTVIIVRVTSLDSNVTYTAEELAESTFGFDTVSVATQMERCSNGKLKLLPAKGNHIHGGVGELSLNEETTGVPPKNLQTALREGFEEKFGSEDKYDLVAYCLPAGTGEEGRGWIAYAYRDTIFSYYNNEWCGSLTSRLHEIGHCIGLGHSGEHNAHEDKFESYEDRSCLMGVSFRRMDGPQECFNGWRNWALGWFADRQTSVDPVLSGSWGGHLAAFVDYEYMKQDDYAVINVRDLYVQFNLADRHNWEVGERANQVTIVQRKGDAEEPSLLLAGIDMNNPTFEYVHEGDTIVFEACQDGKKKGARGGDVRFFKISIHEKGTTSACGLVDTPQPTPALTPSPTSQPTDPPVKKRQKRKPPEKEPSGQGEVNQNSALSEDPSCIDNTLPFKISGKDVTCDEVANDSYLKATHCRRGGVAYLECRKSCDSCGHVEKSPSTTLSTSTLHRRPPFRYWG